MQWYAVQSVMKHRTEGEAAVYEERIVLFLAEGPAEAANSARLDTAKYLAGNVGFEEVTEPLVFSLFDWVKELHGAVVWSCLYRGPTQSEAFRRDRYERYLLPPE